MSELLDIAQSKPIFGMVLTVAAYVLAFMAWQRFKKPIMLNPVLVGTVLVAATLLIFGIPYETYATQTLPINAALSIIVVGLAVPLYRQFPLIAKAGPMIALTLVAGSVTGMATALLLPTIGGIDDQLIATLAPKSVTAAVAVSIAESLGGIAGLTAAVVISTGIFGAVFGPSLLKLAGIDDERAQGFALGLASHAIGTARAIQISDVAGAFASLGMILNGLLTILLTSLAFALFAS